MRSIYTILILILAFRMVPAQNLYVVHMDGPVNPVAVEMISKTIQTANADSASAVLILLDTPGGLMKSMRIIVKAELNSVAPVIVYVSPSGARAGSAGVFITLAAHYAAMAPGTNIGAAHPVNMGGEQDTASIMNEKIVNDAIASIRAIARKRHRNEQWAEASVRESASIPAAEALDLKVVDFIASDIPHLLKQISETQSQFEHVSRRSYEKLRHIDVKKSLRLSILDFISDPTIAYILLLIGIYGILFEFYNPGAVFPGTIAVISLILAFYGMQALSVNIAGILLILVGFVLFILEIKITSYGLLTIGGLVSFILGSVMLFSNSFPEIAIPWSVIIAAAGFTFLFMLFAVGMAIRAQSRKVTTGREGLVGQMAVAATTFKNRQGRVYIHGEIWNAESLTPDLIRKGEQVEVRKVENMTLVVQKQKEK